MPGAAADPGVIAYVRRSTHDIHVISPDGTGDRLLWTYPLQPCLWAPQDLAWRPDGRELAFSSDHEETCSWYQSDVYAIGFNGGGYRRVTNSPACAVLASLPKGSVTVDVSNYMETLSMGLRAGRAGNPVCPRRLQHGHFQGHAIVNVRRRHFGGRSAP